MGCWMYAILAVWFVWLVAEWWAHRLRTGSAAAVPAADADHPQEGVAGEDLQGQRG